MVSIDRNVIAIRKPGEDLRQAWVAEIQAIWVDENEVEVIEVIKTDFRVTQVVNAAMLKHVISKRKAVTEELMAKACKDAEEGDEDEDDLPVGRDPKRRKRELIDEIAKTIDLEIQAASGHVYTLTVQTTWSGNHSLVMRLSDESIKCLTEEPPDGDAVALPVSKEPNVKYKKHFHAACIQYLSLIHI